MEKRANTSLITLVPKYANLSGLNDYQPISLVGCIYKTIAKTLVLRLQKCINEVVGINQFTFIQKGQFIDCAFITNKLVGIMKKNINGSIFLKVDFEKAFDSVAWEYLDFVIKMIGFGKKWCMWIMSCISITSVSILVNGSPTREITMDRGLR